MLKERNFVRMSLPKPDVALYEETKAQIEKAARSAILKKAQKLQIDYSGNSSPEICVINSGALSALARLVARGLLWDALDQSNGLGEQSKERLLNFVKSAGTAAEFMGLLQKSMEELAEVVLKEVKQGKPYGLVQRKQ